MSKLGEPRTITRDDLEAKFRHTARGIGKKTGVIAAVAAVGIAYLIGRRRGRRRRTVVEVRRV
jgi:hypothetical protein